jgi:ABC-type branched-subunit amino acid transport system substrate-binding protein
VKNAGYTGTFSTTLYGDFFTKTLGGTVASALYNPDPSPGMTQMQKDLEAFKPGTKVSSFSNAPAYFAADMFIQALKKVGKNITPEAVQKALATQTWQIKGLAGPTKYPASTVVSSPSCNALVQSDGTQWTTVEKFACSSKTFKIDPKFQG